MLGAIAAILLVVGTISATASVTRDDQVVRERSGKPVVEVQVIESLDSVSE